MPPTANSRYLHCRALTDDKGNLYLEDREPFLYRDLPDNIPHTVVSGDTWWNLAEQYFEGVPDAASHWWAIADFQIDGPAHDPTIALVPGDTVIVPSVRTLVELIKRPPEGAE